MKALVLTRYGPPSALRLGQLTKPSPKDDEVLVKVRATAVNDWDWCFVRGRPLLYRLMFGLRKPKVSVLGAEVAGTVQAVGDNASSFGLGDHVYGDISEAGFGAFAEYVCVRQDALCLMAPQMTFEQAAALPHAAMLALQGLVDAGQLQQGEKVLINGAGGGVGTVGVQICGQYGAEVTGVDSAPKLDTLREVGFDHVIDYRQADFTSNGQRYDLILDTKTNRSPLRYLRSLAPGGRYVTVGGRLPRLAQLFCLAPFVSRLAGKRLHIVALKPNSDLPYINDLFETKGLRSVIDGPYALSDVPRAIERFGEANHVGKVVITVAP
jgi:NADPH:quinone reductase-like Zn-dependent oxidoreductase